MSDVGAAIVCRGLTKRFGNVLALDALDLEVPQGSVFGFLGPNGAGKTTTIRLLTSMARPTAGEATVDGLPVGVGAPNLAGRIGYLDQDPRFPGWMRGRELLALTANLHGLRGAERNDRVNQVLDLVGLTDSARRKVAGYSGGMRQRLGLGMAILAHPPVLLLDEPVSSLDPEGRVDILGAIKALAPASTVLFSSHLLTDVERVCDRVAILDHGRLVTSGPMNELLDRYAHPAYELEVEDGTDPSVARLVDALRTEPWVTEVSHSGSRIRVAVREEGRTSRALVGLVASHEIALVRLDRQRPTLEDVFLELTARDDRGRAA
jgi:ABC-2 type transport system ATP-binding protein